MAAVSKTADQVDKCKSQICSCRVVSCGAGSDVSCALLEEGVKPLFLLIALRGEPVRLLSFEGSFVFGLIRRAILYLKIIQKWFIHTQLPLKAKSSSIREIFK